MTQLKNKTLRALLEQSIEHYSANPALSFAGREPITYKSLGLQVQSLSDLLHSRGIVKGDRVAILSENMPNWAIAYFAVLYLGAVAVPILPDFHAAEILHILRHSGAKGLFVSNKLLDKLNEMEIPDISTTIIIDNFSITAPESRMDKLKDIIREGGREYAKFIDRASKAAGIIQSEVKEKDLATIIYTSGTTGHSKGVMLTHLNLVSNAISSGNVQPVDGTDRFLSILPLSHTYENTIGLILPLMNGACIYYLDKPPVARVLLPAMAQVKPTFMLSVPLILEKIYKSKIAPKLNRPGIIGRLINYPGVRKPLSKLMGRKLMASFGGNIKFFGIGGAPLAPEVEFFLREAKFPYAIGYGLTETSPLIAGCGPSITKFRSTGPAILNVKIKIDNPDPNTGEGEIVVKGPNVMKGYYRDPERTKEVFTKDGWFKTGDLGVLDSDGYLFIKGRLKNMILGPSGENIYPEEIEAHLNETEYVLESLVFKQDEKIMARVHLDYNAIDKTMMKEKLSESQMHEMINDLLESIRKTINKRVSGYSRIHKIIEQPEPFEKTPTKKIKRYLYISS